MDEPKRGVDDFFAGGGTLEGLLQGAVPFKAFEADTAVSGADTADPFRRTHRGSALRLLNVWGRERFLWCPIMGWFAWHADRGVWVEDSAWKVHAAILSELHGIVGDEIAALDAAGVAADEIGKHRRYQHEVEFNGHAEGTMKVLQGMLDTSWTAFDVDANKVTVANGTLWFNGTEVTLHEHVPSDMITKASPVVYDAKAKSSFWESSLVRFLPNQEQRDYVHRLAGSILVRGGVREQILPILYGTGANFKSTFASGLRHALGDELSLETDPSTFRPDKRSGSAPSPDRVRLRGARFVYASEAAGDLDSSFLKRVTGGEEIVARQLHGKTFAFKPAFTLMLLVNEPPSFNDTSDGLWRRVQVVPFSVRIADAERIDTVTVTKLLQEESSGILNWMINGYRSYAASGLSAPASVQLATNSMRGEQDPIGAFVADTVVSVEGDVLTPKELYDAWLTWTEEDADIRSAVGGKTKFCAAVDKVLGTRVQVKVDKSPVRGWKGKALGSKVANNSCYSSISPKVEVPQDSSNSLVTEITATLLPEAIHTITSYYDRWSVPVEKRRL